MPYVQWQHLQDPLAPPGRYHYWKTATLGQLSDGVIDVLAAALGELPTRCTEIHIQHLGGAVARVAEADSAFSGRAAPFFVNLIGTAVWAEELGVLRTRIRALHQQLASQALPTLLPNFSNAEDGTVVSRLGADKVERIAALQRRFDPAGVFATPPAAAP